MRKLLCILTAGFLALVGAQASLAQDMTFFITVSYTHLTLPTNREV